MIARFQTVDNDVAFVNPNYIIRLMKLEENSTRAYMYFDYQVDLKGDMNFVASEINAQENGNSVK